MPRLIQIASKEVRYKKRKEKMPDCVKGSKSDNTDRLWKDRKIQTHKDMLQAPTVGE